MRIEAFHPLPPQSNPGRDHIGRGEQILEHRAVSAEEHRERAKKGGEINTMLFEFIEQSVDQFAVIGVARYQAKLRSNPLVPARTKASGNRIDDRTGDCRRKANR